MNTVIDRDIEPVHLLGKVFYYRNRLDEEEEEGQQRHSSGENVIISADNDDDDDDEEENCTLIRKEVEHLPEDIGVVCQQPADSEECLLLPYSSDDNGTENCQPVESVLHGNGTFPLATDGAENGVVPNGPSGRDIVPGLGGDEQKKEENKKRKRNAGFSSEEPQHKRNRLKETYPGSSKQLCCNCKFPHYRCNCEESTTDQEEDGEVCLICRDTCTSALPYGTPKCKECKPSKIHLECWKRYISQGMERQLKCLTCNKGTIARSLSQSFEESNL